MDETPTSSGQSEDSSSEPSWWPPDLLEKIESASISRKDDVLGNQRSSSWKASQLLWSQGSYSGLIPNGFYSIIPDKKLKETFPNIPSLDDLQALEVDGLKADIIIVDTERDKKVFMLKQLSAALGKGLNSSPSIVIKKIAGLVFDYFKRQNADSSLARGSTEDTHFFGNKGPQLLGQIRHGSCRPRAILFKVLADAVGLESKLVVGLPDDGAVGFVDSYKHMSVVVSLNSMELLVDLMRFPGQLIPFSAKAIFISHISAAGETDSAENDWCDSALEPNIPLYGLSDKVEAEGPGHPLMRATGRSILGGEKQPFQEYTESGSASSEKMVAALLAAGASATAVTNPTAQDPVGKTAALLASERGHTGLAGYEVSPTRYLDSLTIEETDVSEGSAEVEAETAVEYISQRRAQLRGGIEDDFSVKDSSAAVRNAAQAASPIQNAFRAFSFRKRQQKTTRLEYGTTHEGINEVAAASRSYQQTHASSDQFKMQVEEPHSTPGKDVKAWVAMGKQRQKGLNHTCMQKVGHILLGRDDIRKNIMEKILLDRNGGSKCTVICIIGGSGLGKTSLLRVLYNDQELLDTFDKRIWIQMSDKYDILMLFRKIIEFSVNEHCSITNIDLLQELVMEEIANKKFLLFLDDADIEDQQFWTSVLQVLNAGSKGSAVVMATRSSAGAALRNVATNSYFLNPLSEESNLMLLQQYAFVGTDIHTHPDLLMIAKRFITRFGSNPLNLKAIGGLLCHADSISLEMDMFNGNIMPLNLCHDVLPINMKKCLAFCSLFPKGYIFDKHHIVIHWISHGCLRPVEGRELEDAGVENFNELLCRSFFQHSPVHNDKDDKFVMHELVYKVLESVAHDRYFKSEDLLSSIPENILHLSLVSSRFQTIELMSKTEELTDLQTFMVVQPEWQPYKIPFPTLKLVGLDDFFLKFKSIETLDLSHSDTEELPGSIGGLSNLQYLSVNNTSIRTLPSDLFSLSNLQTLQAKDCRFLTELPGDTKKLLKLRHLDVTKELDYVHLPHGIGHLNELRTLPVFHASGKSSHCSISELGNLHNLRGCLWLSGLESVKTGSKAREANLKDKHHLKDLTLQWHDGDIDTDDEDEDAENVAEQVLESLQPHTNLQELAIRGYEGSSFPAWMQNSSPLPNLVSLALDGCCNCTQFPAITHLPSLKFLSVRKMYDVKMLSNNIHGETKFPSLELLNLWEMYGLEELFEESEGDCPRLRKVCVSRCPDLKRLPRAPSLTELVLHCGHQLPDIPELASLVSMKIEGFHGVRSLSLPAAAKLPALKKMEIRSCKELSSVEGLSALTPVIRLKVAGCPKLVLPSLVT